MDENTRLVPFRAVAFRDPLVSTYLNDIWILSLFPARKNLLQALELPLYDWPLDVKFVEPLDEVPLQAIRDGYYNISFFSLV